MESISSALASSAASGKDVNDLLRAIGVLMRLCEGRLTAHALLGPSPPEGSYRSLAADIGALHSLSGALGEVAMGLASTARTSLLDRRDHSAVSGDDTARDERLREACEKTLQALDTALATLRTVSQESERQREVLLETALRRDLSPLLRDEIDQLLHRIGDQSRHGPGTQ